MCGIAGAWIMDPEAGGGPWRGDEVLGRLRHRGPDGDGLLTHPRGALGFRRLAIIDLATGQQPIALPDGDIAVTVNGEIYNHRELRGHLDDHRFASRVDVEVVLHGYARWGLEVLPRLRGMFALAIVDHREDRLVLARDRAGKKPLYWRVARGRLEWASELAALLGTERPPIDPEAVNDYLRFGYVPAPRTVISGVSKLPAGCLLLAEGERIEVRRWSPILARGPRESASDEADWPRRIREALYEAVAMRLESEVPMGFLLSGGVDSSAVFALGAQALEGRTAMAFTLGIDDPRLDETRGAAGVARRYHAVHHVSWLRSADVEALDQAVARCGEPIATDALVPTERLFRSIRHAGVRTVLAGEGSDEIFAGYHKFRLGMAPRGVWERAGAGPVERYLSREEFCFPTLRERRALLGDAAHDEGFGWLEAAIGELDPMSQMLCAEVALRIPDRINHRLDHLSMAHGIEARAPFMDRPLVELALRVPHALRSRGGQSKAILRDAVRRDVPAEILSAAKAPFRAPLTWTSRGSRDLDSDEVREAGLVDERGVAPWRAAAAAGDRRASERLYNLQVLHAWHRTWYLGQRSVASR